MIVWVAVLVSAGLALLALRSMAYAFSHTLAPEADYDQRHGSSHHFTPQNTANVEADHALLSSGEKTMLVIDSLLSIGIALVAVGLAATAALPGQMMIGAVLAQVAVLGSLVAPPVAVDLAGARVRPAALALAVAQLANLIFFVHAIGALL